MMPADYHNHTSDGDLVLVDEDGEVTRRSESSPMRTLIVMLVVIVLAVALLFWLANGGEAEPVATTLTGTGAQ